MGLVSTLRDAFAASTQSANRGGSGQTSKGAYWCHDCNERILDLDVEGDDPPTCPSCGEEMEFERSTGTTGCAC
ncbi:MAG: zinc-ribbon domain-containing protein [Haloferacaceae archaeon]